MTSEQLLWNLFFAFVSAFSGVMLGVLWSRRQWRREIAAQAKRLREHLVAAFRFNLERIDQCLDYLGREDPVIPNFRLDTATPTYVLLSGRHHFLDSSLFDRFSWQRYQLEHINAKLDYLHLHLSAGSIAQLSPSPFESLTRHLEVAKKDITKLLSEFDASAS